MQDEVRMILNDPNGWRRAYMESLVPRRQVVQAVPLQVSRRQRVPREKYLKSLAADIVFEDVEEDEGDIPASQAGAGIPDAAADQDIPQSDAQVSAMYNIRDLKDMTKDELDWANSILGSSTASLKERRSAFVGFRRRLEKIRVDAGLPLVPDELQFFVDADYTRGMVNRRPLGKVMKRFNRILIEREGQARDEVSRNITAPNPAVQENENGRARDEVSRNIAVSNTAVQENFAASNPVVQENEDEREGPKRVRGRGGRVGEGGRGRGGRGLGVESKLMLKRLYSRSNRAAWMRKNKPPP